MPRAWILIVSPLPLLPPLLLLLLLLLVGCASSLLLGPSTVGGASLLMPKPMGLAEQHTLRKLHAELSGFANFLAGGFGGKI